MEEWQSSRGINEPHVKSPVRCAARPVGWTEPRQAPALSESELVTDSPGCPKEEDHVPRSWFASSRHACYRFDLSQHFHSVHPLRFEDPAFSIVAVSWRNVPLTLSAHGRTHVPSSTFLLWHVRFRACSHRNILKVEFRDSATVGTLLIESDSVTHQFWSQKKTTESCLCTPCCSTRRHRIGGFEYTRALFVLADKCERD